MAVTVGRSQKMSKSKKNVVDPVAITEAYGADTARLFMLSDSPPEKDLQWSDAGVAGTSRYLERLWKLALRTIDMEDAIPATLTPDLFAIRQQTHRTIAGVTQDIESFHFNRAVARIRELTNRLTEIDATLPGAGAVLREGVETALLLLGPMVPHITEELWQRLGHTTLLSETAWPSADPALLVADHVTMAVQINGKLRATIEVPQAAENHEVEAIALAHPDMLRHLQGVVVKKVIVVKQKVVNVVV